MEHSKRDNNDTKENQWYGGGVEVEEISVYGDRPAGPVDRNETVHMCHVRHVDPGQKLS